MDAVSTVNYPRQRQVSPRLPTRPPWLNSALLGYYHSVEGVFLTANPSNPQCSVKSPQRTLLVHRNSYGQNHHSHNRFERSQSSFQRLTNVFSEIHPEESNPRGNTLASISTLPTGLQAKTGIRSGIQSECPAGSFLAQDAWFP